MQKRPSLNPIWLKAGHFLLFFQFLLIFRLPLTLLEKPFNCWLNLLNSSTMVFHASTSDDPRILREKLAQAEQHNRALQDRIRELLQELGNREEQIKQLQQELDKYRKELMAFREAMEREREESNLLRNRIQELERELARKEREMDAQKVSVTTANRPLTPMEPSSRSGRSSLEPVLLSALSGAIISEFVPEAPVAKDHKEKLRLAFEQTKIPELRILSLFLAEPNRIFTFDDIARITGESDLESKLQMLEDLKIIRRTSPGRFKLIQGEVEEEVVQVSSWESLSIEDLFDNLTRYVEVSDEESIVSALEEFRDVLMQKEISASTVFFSIRQTIDSLKRGSGTKEDVKLAISEWKSKLIGEHEAL